jgi:hypothetical protein
LTNQEQIIQRYLLGELTQGEQEALEQRYFNDRRLFEQMVQAENALVDRYARGLLAPQVRDRFERYYLNHPKRRERAKFAEAFAVKLDQITEVVAAPPAQTESLLARILDSMRGPRLAWALSLVLLLMAAGAMWFLSETRRLRQDLAKTENEKARQAQRARELEQQVANERLRSEQLSAELDRLRAEQAAKPLPSPSLNATPAFVALVLSAAGIRGTDTGPPKLLVIPAGTEEVRLQLNLEESGYRSYRASLQQAGGKEISARQQLIPKTTKSGASFTLIIPAQRFATGDYILTLRGVTQSGEVEDVSKSLFRVEKK